jgi:hypothetical protein
MAIWQFRLILLPEAVLLDKYEVLPLTIPRDLAEDFDWWSNIQPLLGFERQIDLILPQMESWSKEMRMWGRKHGDDAYVIYEGEDHKRVEEICFRVDARSIDRDLVRKLCILARQLECVLITAEFEILAPDESMVEATIIHSTAKRFVDDPVSTLQNLDQSKFRERLDSHLTKDSEKPPKKE